MTKHSSKTPWIVAATVVVLFSVIYLWLALNPKMSMDSVANEPHFSGVVTEVYESAILVSVNEGEAARASSDLISVSRNVKLNDNKGTDFTVGDEVTVYYDGLIAESYPAQISNVYAIVLVSKSRTIIADDVTKWVDYYQDGNYSWDSVCELAIDEFPGITFKWSSGIVTATLKNNDTKDLFTGMPIWNVYLTDLSGDGLPDFCATVSMGSGIIDTRVIVYDYALDVLYDLSDRMFYDYHLTLEDGRFVVVQTEYLGGEVKSAGSIGIVDGELVAFGIDRTLPSSEPSETTSPVIRTAENTLDEAFYSIVLKLFEMDAGLNSEIKYIAIDMADVFENERVPLETKLRTWVDTLDCELLIGSYEDLVAGGYIIPIPLKGEQITGDEGFREGIMFSFSDASFNGDVLTADATKYRGPLGAVGSTFTARFSTDGWTVDEPGGIWMA